MTEIQIRELIEARLDRAVEIGSGNPGWIDHNDGIFRGMIWALTGEDPGTHLLTDVAKLCRLAGIPHRLEGNTVHYGAEKPG